MSPKECVVSECNREASTMRRPRPIRAVEPLEKKIDIHIFFKLLFCVLNPGKFQFFVGLQLKISCIGDDLLW